MLIKKSLNYITFGYKHTCTCYTRQRKEAEEKYKLKKAESQGRKILLCAIDIDGFEMKKIERAKKWEKRVKSIWQQQPEQLRQTKKKPKMSYD